MDNERHSCNHRAQMFACGLIVGGMEDVADILRLRPHAFIALDKAPYRVLKQRGYPGDARLREITDGGTLSEIELKALVEEIAEILEAGKSVGIACIGGHGRTGYIAACVLGRMGVNDPVYILRRRYCQQAIETEEQML